MATEIEAATATAVAATRITKNGGLASAATPNHIPWYMFGLAADANRRPYFFSFTSFAVTTPSLFVS